MKRPLGVTGLTYLFTLAAVFHFYSVTLITVISCAAVAAAVAAVLVKLFSKRNITVHIPVITASISCLAAVISLFLYQQIIIRPIASDLSGRQLRAEGYVGDDVSRRNSFISYTLHTEKIDGESRSVKLNITSPGSYKLEPFDRIAVTLTPEESNLPHMISKGVYLYAFAGENADLEMNGEKHSSPYTAAVYVRELMKNALDITLDKNAAALSKAVLLGEKQALSPELRQAFSDTGMSYLVVVSGMHLSAVTLLLRRLLKRLKANRFVSLAAVSLFIFIFTAITGFAVSVIRAGIMMTLFYAAETVYRKSDSINSLGAAALVLTLPNPCIVGDAGLLLSFSATVGIVLWADRIRCFCLSRLNLAGSKDTIHKRDKSANAKLAGHIRRFLRLNISLFSVSLAATLWVIPVTVLLLETISPMTVVISLLAYPLTCAVLLLSMVLVILCGALPFPAVRQFFPAPVINIISYLLTELICGFAKLPFCSVKADRSFYYLWIAVTALLTVTGYILRGRRLYVFCAAVISALTLTTGGAITYLTADNSAYLSIYRFGSGYTAAVSKGESISLLSCGGTPRNKYTLLKELNEVRRFDNIVMTADNKRSSAYCPDLLSRYDAGNIFTCEKHTIKSDNAHIISRNTAFTLALNSAVSDRIVSAGGSIYQYIIGERSVLIVPDNAKLSKAPRELLNADFVLFEGKASDVSLLCTENLLSLGSSVGEGRELADGDVFRIKLE